MVSKNKTGQIVLNIIFILLAVTALAPFLLLISSSLTSEPVLMKEGYSFWPKEFSLASYAYLFKSSTKILRGYGITIFVTVVGTVLSVLITTLFAYPLSRKELPGRYLFSFFVFFTMLFNGGLVPTYMMWTQTFHIKDTLWALILPGLLMNAFYVIMMRSFFTANIPDALVEAARIDGAGRWKQALHVTIPGILPTIITMLILRIGNMMSLGFEKIILLYNSSIYETADVISTYVYRKGLLDQSYSFSTAVGLFNSMINLLLLVAANRICKRVTEHSLW